MNRSIGIVALVVLTGGWALTWLILWFVRWLPCQFDSVMCSDLAMPWWLYAVTFILALKPTVMVAGYVVERMHPDKP